MARRIGPSCKLCRREGMKLFLKGTRCGTDKCPFSRRDYAPGQRGRFRPKLSDYGLQLREKQKVKRIYGVLERQFRIYFKRAERMKGITGENLLQLLERRLDNVTFRLGLATSRAAARQLVRHNYIYVNGRRVNIPSYLVKEGDEVEVKGKKKGVKWVRDMVELVAEREVPAWLKADHEALNGKVLGLPKRAEIPIPIQEKLIVELYSK